jgi:hypothetical protein
LLRQRKYKKEKGSWLCLLEVSYACFLSSSNTITAPTMIIVMITPIIPGIKYRSAMDCGAGVGVVVDCGA